MNIRKLGREDKLAPAMRLLEIGETLQVPFKLYTASTIKVKASELKRNEGLTFAVKTNGNVFMYVTRIK